MRDSTLINIKNENYSEKIDCKSKLLYNLNNYNLSFILFKFDLIPQKNSTFLTFMDDQNKIIYPQVYSPQIFKIFTNDSFNFSSLILL